MKELAQEWKNHDWEKAQKQINEWVRKHETVDSFADFENFAGLNISKLELKTSTFTSSITNLVTRMLYPSFSFMGGLQVLFLADSILAKLTTFFWQGSFLEFLNVIPLLTEPKEAGAQAFHVVVPSMPGYAFSGPPQTSRWRMDDTARIFDKLMLGLGYDSYVAQGGDWGSVCARCIGANHKDHCKGTFAVSSRFSIVVSQLACSQLFTSTSALSVLPLLSAGFLLVPCSIGCQASWSLRSNARMLSELCHISRKGSYCFSFPHDYSKHWCLINCSDPHTTWCNTSL